MRDAIAFLLELNRLVPIPAGEECRHGLSIHPDGRLAIVVWVRECAVIPSRKGWREFFLDETDLQKTPLVLAKEIETAVTLSNGRALTEAISVRDYVSGRRGTGMATGDLRGTTNGSLIL